MAKAIIAVCVLAALVCAASARSLQQEVNCKNINQIGGKCDALCNCIMMNYKGSGNKDALAKQCSTVCSTCVTGCQKDGKAPEICSKGNELSGGALGTCLNEYTSADSKKQACLESKYSSKDASKKC